MTTAPERQKVVKWIEEAVTGGARKEAACQLVGVNIRTIQRWQPVGSLQIKTDLRPQAARPIPANKLSEQERQAILGVCNHDSYEQLPPSQIVPKLADQGIYLPSHSRPGVSDVESFFRTLKYCPQWPQKGFESLESARAWVAEFMHWYNHQHQHSKICFVTPAQRHTGQDFAVLKHREDVYAEAKEKHPERWAGPTRNWAPIGTVALNPNKPLIRGE